jgi:hypothetical protein
MGSRRIAGFALGAHHDAALAYGALAVAVAVRGGAVPGVVFQSWHSTLEFELRSLRNFATKAAAKTAGAAWIEDYNHVRRHSALGMRCPVDYERSLVGKDAAWTWPATTTARTRTRRSGLALARHPRSTCTSPPRAHRGSTRSSAGSAT